MDSFLRRIIGACIVSLGGLMVACGQNEKVVDTPPADNTIAASASRGDEGGSAPEHSPEVSTLPELPLPALPSYPAPQTALTLDQHGVIYFPTKSPYDFSRVLHGFDELSTTTGKGTLILPDQASANAPVPAMVILHGSGGIREGREFEYAELFAQHGIAGFVVDYYEPRGALPQTPYQLKTMITTEIDVLTDAYSALNILSTHPAIDNSRIGVTGYSYGGMATRYALDAQVREIMAPDIPQFALHIDVYGPCFQTVRHGNTTGAPYMALHGTNDNSVDPALCQDVYKDIEASGSRVESHVFDGAGHAWEVLRPLGEFGQSYVRGCRFTFDPQTGALLIDGQEGPVQPTPDMTRAQRAGVRAGLGELAGPCVGTGYLVGHDPQTDEKSKQKQIAFLKREFGL